MVAARVLWRRSTPAPAPHLQTGADLVKACAPDNFCKKLKIISRHQTAKWFEAGDSVSHRRQGREGGGKLGIPGGRSSPANRSAKASAPGVGRRRYPNQSPHLERERESARGGWHQEERRRLAVRVTWQYIYGPGCSWAFNRPSPFALLPPSSDVAVRICSGLAGWLTVNRAGRKVRLCLPAKF
jgi:hypothetical protein